MRFMAFGQLLKDAIAKAVPSTGTSAAVPGNGVLSVNAKVP